MPKPEKNADSDGFDDFGIDLYAAPEPSFPELDMDESDNSVGVINKTDLGWQRQSQESHSGSQIFERGDSDRTFSRGQGFGQPIPPLGYVCHRCGVPGHFIKHCPTNVDPAYDIQRVKLPVCIPKTTSKAEWEGLHAMVDGSVAVMQPDEMTSVKGADNILPRIPNAELPSELRCSLCKTIFQEAIMIPCCQYSFCHECIRQVLIEKGKCPQCNSTKFKIDDLLPNIALRQAIERFLESQLTLSSADNCAAKPAPDGESAIQAKATSMAPSRGELQIPQSPSATVGGIEKESNQVIAESTGELFVGNMEKDADYCADHLLVGKSYIAVCPLHRHKST